MGSMFGGPEIPETPEQPKARPVPEDPAEFVSEMHDTQKSKRKSATSLRVRANANAAGSGTNVPGGN
jgi:hypothetical protein